MIKNKKKNIQIVEKKEIHKKIEYPISFVEYAETLDTYTTRALKIYANIDNLLIEKTRSDWDFLLEQLKFKPIV